MERHVQQKISRAYLNCSVFGLCCIAFVHPGQCASWYSLWLKPVYIYVYELKQEQRVMTWEKPFTWWNFWHFLLHAVLKMADFPEPKCFPLLHVSQPQVLALYSLVIPKIKRNPSDTPTKREPRIADFIHASFNAKKEMWYDIKIHIKIITGAVSISEPTFIPIKVVFPHKLCPYLPNMKPRQATATFIRHLGAL